MKKGDVYKLPQPNLYSLRDRFELFVKDIEKAVKPVGLVLSCHGTSPKWNGEKELFDLTKLDKMTFHLTIVRSATHQ